MYNNCIYWKAIIEISQVYSACYKTVLSVFSVVDSSGIDVPTVDTLGVCSSVVDPLVFNGRKDNGWCSCSWGISSATIWNCCLTSFIVGIEIDFRRRTTASECSFKDIRT